MPQKSGCSPRRKAAPTSRIGHRLIPPLTLARSLDREHDGALPEALAALTGAFDGVTEEIEEIEALLADAVRLAAETGDLSTAQALTGRAEALAAASEIPHRSGERAVLPRPARPRRLAAAHRGGALRGGRPAAAAGEGTGGGGRVLYRRRRPRPGAGRLHHRRRGLHHAGRGRGRGPAAGHLPGPRHPARGYSRQSSGMNLAHRVHRSWHERTETRT